MSDRKNEFLKKNLSVFHIAGILLGWIIAIIYWYKSGKYSENILKNNVLLISVWGITLGYVTFDLVKGALAKKK